MEPRKKPVQADSRQRKEVFKNNFNYPMDRYNTIETRKK